MKHRQQCSVAHRAWTTAAAAAVIGLFLEGGDALELSSVAVASSSLRRDVGLSLQELRQWEEREASSVRKGFLEARQIAFNATAVFVETSSLEAPMQCGQLRVADAESDKFARCPKSCPVFSEVMSNDQFCDFLCVPGTKEDCIAQNPKTPVVDLDRGICRECMVDGCKVCSDDGTDSCVKCHITHYLRDGKCHSYYWFMTPLAVVLGSVVGFVILLWMASLVIRPATNSEVLKEALAARSRAKLHMPKEEAEEATEGEPPSGPSRKLWPLCLNLTWTPAGGVGMSLHFSFQLMLIVWSSCIVLAWYWMGLHIDPELLELGTHKTGTERQNCVLIAFGYEAQNRLMWTKVYFTYGLYIASFLGCLIYAVVQLHHFRKMDERMTTHKDFCAVVSGVPEFTGEEKAEELLKSHLEEQLGVNVVYCSIAWDYYNQEDSVLHYVDEDGQEREDSYIISKGGTPHPTPRSPKKDAKKSQRLSASQEATRQQSQTFESFAKKHDDHAEAALEQAGHDQQGCWASIRRTWGKFYAFMEWLFSCIENFFLAPKVQQILNRSKVRRRVPGQAEMEGHSLVVTQASSSAEAEDGASHSDVDAHEKEHKDILPLETLLKGMKSMDHAFVIFESETLRDEAVAKAAEMGGVKFRDTTMTVEESIVEPEALQWRFCYSTTPKILALKVVSGVGSILTSLAVWVALFYMPASYYLLSFNYANGAEPDMLTGIALSMVVVVGNLAMYFVCSEVSEKIGFKYSDDREACYMMLYCFACFLQIFLDLFVTYFVAYQMMVGVNMRTYDGRFLADVGTDRYGYPFEKAITGFTDIFETYAMQRALGKSAYEYAVSTFPIPFILEPVVGYASYKVMALIIGCQPAIYGAVADGYLQPMDMDLSRYADLILNVLIAVVVLYFPGGFILQTFGLMAFSHICIYIYDHYRLLRTSKACNIPTMTVSWWAQWMLSVPCALLLACAVFKSNCTDGHHCAEGMWIVVKSAVAFFLHMLVHTLLLVKVVPRLAFSSKEPSKVSYKACAASLSQSFFNTNPVFCLRSKHVYLHDPPCDYSFIGREHLCRVNDEIGCHFQDKAAEVEDYDRVPGLTAAKEGMKHFGRKMSEMFEKTSAPKEKILDDVAEGEDGAENEGIPCGSPSVKDMKKKKADEEAASAGEASSETKTAEPAPK
eukprot:TRINITY_DN91385_c0_g1_i1.p1 TRINITY_DN91385_c0_g1~~TRINITY_DN91385_c0_g1_i1.p1  ORF type:complete len:1167 (-),score=310.77 TRINITY_DN91385_c0_g1_i1:92-3592(-)